MKKNILTNIKMIVMDVDGVLTDGRIVFGQNGEELKYFSIHDGYGIKEVEKKGVIVAIVTGRYSQIVNVRAKELGVEEVFQGVEDKGSIIEDLKQKYSLSQDDICAIGDDVPDISMLKKAGLKVAVKNAVKPVLQIADYVTEKEGGRGAVREVVDMIIQAKEKSKCI